MKKDEIILAIQEAVDNLETQRERLISLERRLRFDGKNKEE